MNEITKKNSKYNQTPLANLTLPDDYAKLIKRIMNLNGSLDENLLLKLLAIL